MTKYAIGDMVVNNGHKGTIMAHGEVHDDYAVLWEDGDLSLEFPSVLQPYDEPLKSPEIPSLIASGTGFQFSGAINDLIEWAHSVEQRLGKGETK